MVLLIANKNKYVMLSCNQKSMRFQKNEAIEVDDKNAKFLTDKYEDIVFYKKTNKKTKAEELQELEELKKAEELKIMEELEELEKAKELKKLEELEKAKDGSNEVDKNNE